MLILIIFSLSKAQKLLSARDNQKLSNLLSKGSERSVYWNEYKTKNENRNTTDRWI